MKRDFERFYKAALNECDRLIWIMDYDCDDCRDPIADASWVVERARLLDRRGAVTAAFLVMEFESLFLWDKRALTRVFGDVVARQALPDNPEIVRNAKGCISSLLPPGQRYKPTVHQARLVGHLDLDVLEDRSPSFRRLDGALLKLASSS